MRFQDEHLFESNKENSDCINAKFRKIEGKTPEEYSHFHIGGTELCVDYAKKALLKACAMTDKFDRTSRKCKYINNYPSAFIAHSRYSSVYV